MKNALLIPVKDPARAKFRMAPLLSAQERSELAWEMFEYVSNTVSATAQPETVMVVTDSRQVSGFARSLGWDVIFEESQISESASVDHASQILMERSGAESVLRLPADLPLVRPDDIGALLDFPRGPRTAVLIPSWDRMGTNALLRTPPDLFPSRFGHNSLVLHVQEALRAQAQVVTLENSRIAFDLDDAGDLGRFMTLDPTTRIHRFLNEIDIQQRLRVYAIG